MIELTESDLIRIKLSTALSSAPRPTPKPDAEWVVRYMDWFFQMRIDALENK